MRILLVVALCTALVLCHGASKSMECALCTVSLGLVEQHELQLKLQQKLLEKCDDGKNALKKTCEKAVGKIIDKLLKKARPETLCNKMSMCDGYEQCQLFPQWPLESLPSSPKEWPVERRKLLEGIDFQGDDHHVLKEWLTSIFRKHFVSANDEHPNFYTWARVLSSVIQDLHSDDKETDDGLKADDGCDKKDINCHIEAVAEHKPLQDADGDLYSSKEAELRGTDWRGTDCDDSNGSIYPGRKTEADGIDSNIDHNCNSIFGKNDTGSYEQQFCQDSQQRGLIMLGDSATAHFHLPPQWLTADGWNLNGARTFDKNELDFPMCSWGTGHVSADKCPYQYPLNDVPEGEIVSLYTLMRERNLCNNNDFENVGVNGARMTSSDSLINAMARDKSNDHPALVWLTLLGNDVCNGHVGTDHMTTPEVFYDKAMESLTKLDSLLPPNSYVVSVALFDGELLYDTMHAQQHPLGSSYSEFYDFLNCLEVSPCWGWLNSNSTAREQTTTRAQELDAVYEKILSTESQNFKNFEYIYFKPQWKDMFERFGKEYGVDALPRLIEASDGFHPSQTGNAVFAMDFFKFLEENHPEAIGPINPHNDEIRQMFFSA